MSMALPALNAWHMAQVLHGSPSTGLRQFIAFARIRPVLVLPVPRGPQNK
jgi:hypothetical protein